MKTGEERRIECWVVRDVKRGSVMTNLANDLLMIYVSTGTLIISILLSPRHASLLKFVAQCCNTDVSYAI